MNALIGVVYGKAAVVTRKPHGIFEELQQNFDLLRKHFNRPSFWAALEGGGGLRRITKLGGVEGGGRKFLGPQGVQQHVVVGRALQQLREGLGFDRGGESVPGVDDREGQGTVADRAPLDDGFGLECRGAIGGEASGQGRTAEFARGDREHGEGGGAALGRLRGIVDRGESRGEDLRQSALRVGFLQRFCLFYFLLFFELSLELGSSPTN